MNMAAEGVEWTPLFPKEAVLTATPKLFKEVLYFLPLGGILARWGLKWNEGSEIDETLIEQK